MDSNFYLCDALFLSVSAVSMTGLSTVDFGSKPAGVHAATGLLIVLGSPMLMSLCPVFLRWLSLRRQMHSREGERGAAFFGIKTSRGQDSLALEIILRTVFLYWLLCQLLCWLILSCASGSGGSWNALFLTTSAWHNAGLLTHDLPFGSSSTSPLVLTVVMLLILAGNSCFPLALRFLVWLQYSSARSRDEKHVLSLLLKYPRTCYTHIFPNYATLWLAVVTSLLTAAQIFALFVADCWAYPAGRMDSGGQSIMQHLSTGDKVWATIFQSVSTRTAGFSVLDLSLVSPTSGLIFMVCMWISICPVIVVMRSTGPTANRSVKLEYSSAITKSSLPADQGVLKNQLQTFLSENSVLLLSLLFLILLGEEYATTTENVRESRFMRIIFEFCSAYGTVGLSMSSQPWSECGNWTVTSKLCLMVVMLMGRLRGLPESIDPVVQLSMTDFEALRAESEKETDMPNERARTHSTRW